MSEFNREDLILKLQKRKTSLGNIVSEKRESLEKYKLFVSGQTKVQNSIQLCLQKKQDRLDEYEEHYELLQKDLANIDSKSEEEIQIIWDFYESFVQTSKFVQKSLREKLQAEEKANPNRVKKGRSKSKAAV